MADQFEGESGAPRQRGHLDISDAPLTAAVLKAHPSLWPIDSSDVPTGWDAEVASALRALVELAEASGVVIRVAQIKSKLASLRVYLDIDERTVAPRRVVGETPNGKRLEPSVTPGSVRERATAIVRTAEARCATLCETCGAPGVRGSHGGWLSISCRAHAERA